MEVSAEELTRNRRVGTGVLIVALLMGAGLFMRQSAQRLTTEQAAVVADFRTASGLRRGSSVQLAGLAVGYVKHIDFVKVQYQCDPLTEDTGRYGEGRTDTCESDLFCSPDRLCAELEPYVGKGQHPRCNSISDCASDEVCVNSGFRRRNSRLVWGGPHGICANFNSEHWRTRVQMQLPREQLQLFSTGTTATVAANSVLGDQRVNISPGRGFPLDPEALAAPTLRVHSKSSFGEDIDRLRRRVESFLETADVAIVAIVNVIDELKAPRTMKGLKGLLANIAIISHEVAYGDGLVGALLNSPLYKRDLGQTIGGLEGTADGLSHTVTRANSILGKIDRNLGPILADGRGTLEDVVVLLDDLDNPENKSVVAVLLRDEDNTLASDLGEIFENAGEIASSTANIAGAIDRGDGTVGLLINDNRVGADVGRLLHNLARAGLWRAAVLLYLEREGYTVNIKDARDSARP